MENEKRNKFLSEMLGLSKISKLDEIIFPTHDFKSWDDFGKLWNYATKQKWWNEFLIKSKAAYEDNEQSARFIVYTREIVNIVNPDIFADKLYDFLKDNKYN